MRGADTFSESLFSTRRLDDFVPASHPLRVIRKMTNATLARMQPLFAGMYAADIKGGRPSVAPEKLLQSAGYATSQQRRKLIEQGFGWAKTVGGTGIGRVFRGRVERGGEFRGYHQLVLHRLEVAVLRRLQDVQHRAGRAQVVAGENDCRAT